MRPKMRIRHSEENDFGRIMEIYSYARSFMKEHGNPNQWGPTNWPPAELIHADIKNEKSYVCLGDDERVIGTFFYDYGENIETTYQKIADGTWIDNSAYGVVHRIASDGSVKGIGTYCIEWAYNQCKHLRIDTHPANVVMQNLLSKLKFKHCGTIYVEEDEYPRMAYEKNENNMFN